jgi:hypothetical protein
MPTDRPSSIQKPAFNCRVRSATETTVRRARMAGVDHRDASTSPVRSARVRSTTLTTKREASRRRLAAHGRRARQPPRLGELRARARRLRFSRRVTRAPCCSPWPNARQRKSHLTGTEAAYSRNGWRRVLRSCWGRKPPSAWPERRAARRARSPAHRRRRRGPARAGRRAPRARFYSACRLTTERRPSCVKTISTVSFFR